MLIQSPESPVRVDRALDIRRLARSGSEPYSMHRRPPAQLYKHSAAHVALLHTGLERRALTPLACTHLNRRSVVCLDRGIPGYAVQDRAAPGLRQAPEHCQRYGITASLRQYFHPRPGEVVFVLQL